MFKEKVAKIKPIFLPCSENNFHPHLLNDRFLIYFLLVSFLLKLIVVPLYYNFPKSIFFSEIISSDLIKLTNKERQSLGLAPLKENTKLNQAAFLKAQDILRYGYFSHQSPQGISPWYWFKRVGYNYQKAGENLAIGFLDSREVYQAWDNSLSHRNNLLNPCFQEIGVAVAKGEFQGAETQVVVQLFGLPAKEHTIPLIENQNKTETGGTTKTGELMENKTNETMKREMATSVLEAVTLKSNNSFQFKLWQIMVSIYNRMVSKIITCAFILLIIIFILTFFIGFNYGFWHRDLIFKTFICLIALFLFSVLNNEMMLNLIPHTLIIYAN